MHHTALEEVKLQGWASACIPTKSCSAAVLQLQVQDKSMIHSEDDMVFSFISYSNFICEVAVHATENFSPKFKEC